MTGSEGGNSKTLVYKDCSLGSVKTWTETEDTGGVVCVCVCGGCVCVGGGGVRERG